MIVRSLLVVGILLGRGDVLAQESAGAPAGLNLQALPTATVLDVRGGETSGRLLKIDRESVVLLVDGGERRFELREVSRVTRSGDSLKNGAIIGAVVGLVLGALTSGLAECQRDGHWTGCSGGQRVGLAAVSSGMYALVGAGIDKSIGGPTVLYQAPMIGRTGSAGASIAVRVSW